MLYRLTELRSRRALLWLVLLAGAAGGANAAGKGRSPQKAIVSVQWMTEDFSQAIENALPCQTLGILVETRGYRRGEPVRIVIGDDGDPSFEAVVYGKVAADGRARVRWNHGGCDAPKVHAVPSPRNAPRKTGPAHVKRKQLP